MMMFTYCFFCFLILLSYDCARALLEAVPVAGT